MRPQETDPTNSGIIGERIAKEAVISFVFFFFGVFEQKTRREGDSLRFSFFIEKREEEKKEGGSQSKLMIGRDDGHRTSRKHLSR